MDTTNSPWSATRLADDALFPPRSHAGAAAARSLHFQDDHDNRLLLGVLTSRQCLWQV